jgi:DNA-binding NtrC family response regulator
VDDEEAIRFTLGAILRKHDFEVSTAASVAEALQKITSEKFDVLLSDLNIGNPGDGLTVISAMLRTQPEAVTMILTGYPAFETALEAIRQQVDDYIVKPASIPVLVSTIESKLATPPQQRQLPPPRRVAMIGEVISLSPVKLAGNARVVSIEDKIVPLDDVPSGKKERREILVQLERE